MNDDEVYVAINKQNIDVNISFPVQPFVTELRDELDGKTMAASHGKISTTVPARSGRIFSSSKKEIK